MEMVLRQKKREIQLIGIEIMGSSGSLKWRGFMMVND